MIKQRTHRPAAPLLTESTTATGADKSTPEKVEATGVDLGNQIGHKLRAMFEDVVAEPVPEKFRALLDELERRSGGS
jgi:hypothetical protein